jgi:hypothetical protein
MVGFRGVRPDPGEAFDDSKLTGFGWFSPSDKVSDWIADRLAEGPTGIGACGVDYSACSAARTNVVFTNSYVDNNSSLVSE